MTGNKFSALSINTFKNGTKSCIIIRDKKMHYLRNEPDNATIREITQMEYHVVMVDDDSLSLTNARTLLDGEDIATSTNPARTW